MLPLSDMHREASRDGRQEEVISSSTSREEQPFTKAAQGP